MRAPPLQRREANIFLHSASTVMGTLPPDTPCGWCGRPGAGYISDGIYPPVPLCAEGGPGGAGCLFGTRKRVELMSDALTAIFLPPSKTAPWALQLPVVRSTIAKML